MYLLKYCIQLILHHTNNNNVDAINTVHVLYIGVQDSTTALILLLYMNISHSYLLLAIKPQCLQHIKTFSSSLYIHSSNTSDKIYITFTTVTKYYNHKTP